MRPSRLACSLALVICAVAGRAVHSEEDKNKAGQDLVERLAVPGEEHKRLEPTIGKFSAKAMMWFGSGKPVEATAESTNEWILGGRFVRQTYTGTVLGKPFEGIGQTGFDNYKKKYVATWSDTMSTSLMMTEGEADASGKTITSHGEVDEPSAGPGKKTKVRTVLRIESPAKHVYEMYLTRPGEEKEAKALEITYERK